jgi:hypothetical protein
LATMSRVSTSQARIAGLPDWATVELATARQATIDNEVMLTRMDSPLTHQ